MNDETAINIAVTSVMASALDNDTKQEVIKVLRALEEQQKEIEELKKKNKTLADNHFQQRELTQSRVDKLYKLNLQLHRENKHYREVFKQIKLQILFDGAIEDHRKNIIEIIDEALEGEK